MDGIQTEVPEQTLSEESSWEVFSDDSEEDEFQESSEESDHEDSGDEVHRRRRSKRTALSQCRAVHSGTDSTVPS